jgi:hypothetical protein
MKTFLEMVQDVRSRYIQLDARWKMLLWVGAVLGVIVISGLLSIKAPAPLVVKVKEPVEPAVVKKEENGYFLGEEVDRKAYIEGTIFFCGRKEPGARFKVG